MRTSASAQSRMSRHLKTAFSIFTITVTAALARMKMGIICWVRARNGTIPPAATRTRKCSRILKRTAACAIPCASSAPQQQHTVYDLATHPVSSFRVDPKIYPYCTLFSLRLQFGHRKRASHPCTEGTPLPQNQIRTGSCGRLQTRRRWRSGTWPAGRRPADSFSPPRRHRR